mmetsp:Transcript_14034/g.21428  ORF Transcript_14034/g.21428 Transcript_14034/m.21428 type:complete len:448 (-) Transcript_14034:658-2001(-)
MHSTRVLIWFVIRILLYVCNFLIFIYGSILTHSVLSNQRVRRVSYNLYLVFLIIPDITLNMAAFIIPISVTDWSTLLVMHSKISMSIHMGLTAFYFISNFYINGIVAYEINKLAFYSHRGVKIGPPPQKRAYLQSISVFLGATLFAVWVVLPVPWSLVHFIYDSHGQLMYKMGSARPDGIFSPVAASAIMSSFVLIPTFYVLYMRWSMWRKRLLPRRGRTRILSTFFWRIMVVFFCFYYPGMALILARSIINDATIKTIINAFARLFEILQAATTLYIASQKYDINEAIKGTISSTKRILLLRAICSKTDENSNQSSINSVHEQLDSNIASENTATSFKREYNADSNVQSNVEGITPRSAPNSIANINEWELDDMYSPFRGRVQMNDEAYCDVENLWENLEDENLTQDAKPALENSIDFPSENAFSKRKKDAVLEKHAKVSRRRWSY